MKELVLKALVENIPQVIAFVDEQLEALDCPMKIQLQIDMAIDEIFCNIASYAYGETPGEASVLFDYDEEKRQVSITFADSGIPFNPLEMEEPDVTLSAAERKIGGLGIFLVKKTMDDMIYQREDEKNLLTIRKTI